MFATAVRAQLARAPQTWVYLVAAMSTAILLARQLSAHQMTATGHHMHAPHHDTGDERVGVHVAVVDGDDAQPTAGTTAGGAC